MFVTSNHTDNDNINNDENNNNNNNNNNVTQAALTAIHSLRSCDKKKNSTTSKRMLDVIFGQQKSLELLKKEPL